MTAPDSQHLAELRERVLTPDELDQLPPPELLVEDLFVANTTAAVFGPPGNYKTFFVTELGLCVSSGTAFYGHKVKQGPVVFVSAEGNAGLGKRQRAWREMHPEADVSCLRWLPVTVNLTDGSWSLALAQLVAEVGAVLVVIDTLNRSLGGHEENSSETMGNLIAASDRIREMSNATVLFVHHTPRGATNLRGHSSLDGALDTAILMQKSADERTVTVSVDKQKDFAKYPPFELEFRPVGASALLEVPRGRGTLYELVGQESQVKQAIWDFSGTDGLTAPVLLELSGVSKTSFYRALKSLVQRGIVRNIGTEKRPRYAPATPPSTELSQLVPTSPKDPPISSAHSLSLREWDTGLGQMELDSK